MLGGGRGEDDCGIEGRGGEGRVEEVEEEGEEGSKRRMVMLTQQMRIT